MDIIGSEIHRLDRVVQILVDFTRPRDLRLEDVDFRNILESVSVLAAPDAARHGVRVVLEVPSHESPAKEGPNEDDALMVREDSDLMKQAILNLVLHGGNTIAAIDNATLNGASDDEMILA